MAIVMESPVEVLERRLSQGADILFDMEQRGDTGPEYERWLDRWILLLADYEAMHSGVLQAA